MKPNINLHQLSIDQLPAKVESIRGLPCMKTGQQQYRPDATSVVSRMLTSCVDVRTVWSEHKGAAQLQVNVHSESA
jgi:hypothetical protein